jgi:hypothetical protein
MDWNSVINSVIGKRPGRGCACCFGFIPSGKKSRQLQKLLFDTQASTITTLEGVKNALDIIRSEVSK